ncbi:MAG: nucleotide exchange factor GrpE [Acidiferrobacteraceae bacterium]
MARLGWRKRYDRDRAGRKRLLAQFLPVLDNLERALAYDGENIHGLRAGVQQTLKGFEALLASEGVRTISIKGLPFDPRTAEAIGTYDVAGVAENIVVEEAQKGYMLGSELLRPAKVIVASPAESERTPAP